MARPSGKREHAAVAAPVRRTDAAIRALLALIHVVCPLLFFTNLTRNPYFTQIALLNIGIALCGVVWAADCFRRGEWRIPRFPFDVPLAAFLGAALLSSIVSFATHASLRPGLSYEMTRVWIFTLVNSVMALYLPGLFTTPIGENPRRLSIWSDISLAVIWGAAWLMFHEWKNPDPTVLIWDTYGAILWMLAAGYAIYRTRNGEMLSFIHLIFAVCLVAGAYGILQYWGRDIIWTSPVQPYGGRPVSTFGNPNFLSSYLMMCAPLALVFAVRSSGTQSAGYGLIALVSGLAVLSTLTRSTYVGLVVALGVTGATLYQKGDGGRLVKPALVALVLFIAILLIFPHTPVSQVQSPLARFTEIFAAAKTGQAYGPWHQRILIWSSAWDMLQGHWLFGRGWGTFELFYPFFQGKFLLVPFLAQWRTHANNAHNILLEIWAQTGFVGMGAALWLFVTIVSGGWLVARRGAAGAGRLAAAAFLGGTVGMVADNFFGNVSIFFAVPAFLFWWNVGALFNESRPAPMSVGRLSDSIGRPLMVLFAAFCVATSVYFVMRWNQEVWYFRGFKLAKTPETELSIASLEKAMKWFPGEVNTDYELGNALSGYARTLNQKDRKEEARAVNERAVKAYQAAINANPGYDEIYFNQGVTYGQLGDTERALERIRLSLFINPLLHEGYNSLGALLLKLGQDDEALEVFKHATEAFPREKDLWNNYGYALTQKGRHQEAFDAYKRSVELEPTFMRGWANLGMAAKASGRQDPLLAVPSLIDAMEKDLQKNDMKAALEMAKKVSALLPDSADAHLSTGNLYFYVNDFPNAEKEIKRAIELNPDFQPAYANLGRMYAIHGDLPQAREFLGKAVALNPGDADSRKALENLPK